MTNPDPKLVRSRDELAQFVRGMAADLAERPETWENADLGRFLEAMSAWIDSMDAYYRNIGEPIPTQPDWRTLAEILGAARINE